MKVQIAVDADGILRYWMALLNDFIDASVEVIHAPSEGVFLQQLQQISARPQVILCARRFKTSDFGAAPALTLLHESAYNIPLIVLGDAGDDEACIVPLMQQGAADYITPAEGQRLLSHLAALRDFSDAQDRATKLSTGTWEALSKSEQGFNSIFQALPLAMLIVDLHTGVVINANHSALMLFNVESMTETPLTALDLFNHSEAQNKLMQNLLVGGELPEQEITLLLPENRRLEVIISANPIDLLGRNCSAITIQDMTQHYKALRAVEASEQKLRTIFEDSTDVIMILDASFGIIKAANHALWHIMGRPVKDTLYQPITLLFPPEARYSANDLLGELKTYGAVFETGEFLHANGSLIPMDLTATIIEWEGEDAILATFRDIRDRQAVQKALRQMTERLQMVIDNAPVTLFALDEKGYFTLCEGKGWQGMNLPSHTPIGQSAFEIYHSIPRLVRGIQQALNGETKRFIADSAHTISETYLSPVRDDKGKVTGIIGVMFDITEQERARRELLKSEQHQVEMQKERELLTLKQGFTSMISHEFRIPLSIIQSSASILNTYAERLTLDKRRHHLQKISDQVNYMLQLMEDMLLISKAQSGGLGFNPAEIDILALSLEVIEQLELTSPNSKHHFSFIHNGDLAGLYLDGRFVRYITNNLLNNAIKYTPGKKRIRYSLHRENDHLLIIVQDEGIGIPKEEQEHLFDMFYRASNARVIQGTGLGLALVKQCVQAHNGEIIYQSEIGKGTTFTVRLPCVRKPGAGLD